MRAHEPRTTKSIGDIAEDIAVDHLESLGWFIIERQWAYKKMGELDIVADDGTDIVFVEVRYRARTDFGLPEQTLSPTKVSKLRRTAQMYLLMKGIRTRPCRFDVVALDMMGGKPNLRHYRNCF